MGSMDETIKTIKIILWRKVLGFVIVCIGVWPNSCDFDSEQIKTSFLHLWLTMTPWLLMKALEPKDDHAQVDPKE